MLRVACITLAASLIASAGPLACTTGGTLSSYIALGDTGCTVGNTLFNDFTSLGIPNGTTQIDPGAVTVDPVATALDQTLIFNLGVSTSNGNASDINIGFNAAPLPFTGPIDGSEVALTGSMFTGGGSVTAIHDACPDGAFVSGTCTTTDYDSIAIASDIFSQLTAGSPFPSSTNVAFMTDIDIDSTGGTASLDSASVTVNSVPEPASLGLFCGAAMAALLFFRARRSGV